MSSSKNILLKNYNCPNYYSQEWSITLNFIYSLGNLFDTAYDSVWETTCKLYDILALAYLFCIVLILKSTDEVIKNFFSVQVTSAQQLPSGTTALNFQVTDACGSTGTGTLTIVVTNVVSYGETTNAILFKERVY